jgi:hypothetical protein
VFREISLYHGFHVRIVNQGHRCPFAPFIRTLRELVQEFPGCRIPRKSILALSSRRLRYAGHDRPQLWQVPHLHLRRSQGDSRIRGAGAILASSIMRSEAFHVSRQKVLRFFVFVFLFW